MFTSSSWQSLGLEQGIKDIWPLEPHHMVPGAAPGFHVDPHVACTGLGHEPPVVPTLDSLGLGPHAVPAPGPSLHVTPTWGQSSTGPLSPGSSACGTRFTQVRTAVLVQDMSFTWCPGPGCILHAVPALASPRCPLHAAFTQLVWGRCCV